MGSKETVLKTLPSSSDIYGKGLVGRVDDGLLTLGESYLHAMLDLFEGGGLEHVHRTTAVFIEQIRGETRLPLEETLGQLPSRAATPLLITMVSERCTLEEAHHVNARRMRGLTVGNEELQRLVLLENRLGYLQMKLILEPGK